MSRKSKAPLPHVTGMPKPDTKPGHSWCIACKREIPNRDIGKRCKARKQH